MTEAATMHIDLNESQSMDIGFNTGIMIITMNVNDSHYHSFLNKEEIESIFKFIGENKP